MIENKNANSQYLVEELPEHILDEMDACACQCGLSSGAGGGTTR